MSKLLYIPKTKRNLLLTKGLYKYSFSKDKINDIVYWIHTCRNSDTRKISMYLEEKPVSEIVFQISVDKNTNKAEFYIHNFQTPNEAHKNKSFGNKTLKETEKTVKTIERKAKISIVKISGRLFDKDVEYWNISLPMYFRFSERIIGKNLVCKVNGKKVEKSQLSDIIAQHISEKKAIYFEFSKPF